MVAQKDLVIGRVFAIGAAIAYGLSQVLVRVGLADSVPPLVGAAIALLSGTIFLAGWTGRTVETNLAKEKKSIFFLAMSGLTSGIAVLSFYFALSMTPAVIVSPLISTQPLFALLLSHFFLRRLERVTLPLLLGAILVVGGVILITVGRTA